MENELKPKELSKDLVHSMHKSKEPSTKFSGVLQVLGCKDGNSFMTLSDGFSHVDAAIFKSLRPKVDTLNIVPKDILLVSLLLHKETVDVVTGFEKIYSNVNEVIGKPIPYANYLERECINPEGSCAIPRIHWDPVKPRAAGSANTNSGSINSLPRAQIVGGDDEVMKISLLSTGAADFLIKAKVIKKSTRKEFNQGKGKGSVFDLVIADDSDEIKCSFFNTSCDKYYEQMTVGKVYLFANGEVRKGGKFNTCSNPNEIYFNSKTDIAECPSESFTTCVKYKFKRIGEIMKENNYTQVDLAGVVSSIGEAKDIQLKSGETKAKQTFKVRDDSNFEIELTIWGHIEGQSQIKEGDTVIFTSLTVGEFNKVKVLNSVKDTTRITINPDNSLTRIVELNKWKESGQDQVRALKTDWKPREQLLVSIGQLKKETEFLSEDMGQKQSFTISGYIANFGTSFTYPKCPYADCFKKAIQEQDNDGRACTICGTHGQLEQPPVPKYIGSMRVVDHTDSVYLSFNHDSVGQVIFGCDASAMNEQAQNKDELTEFLKTRSSLKFTFKVYVKFEEYMNQKKLKYIISQCYDQVGNRLKYENITLLNTIAKLNESLI